MVNVIFSFTCLVVLFLIPSKLFNQIFSEDTLIQADFDSTSVDKLFFVDSTVSIQLNSTSVLDIRKDSSGNSYLVITNLNRSYLNDISGCGNCTVYFSDSIKIQKVNFSNSGIKEYVVFASINGSTYGAGRLFVLWNEYIERDGYWNILKVPFDRFEILNIRGIDYIVEYPPSGGRKFYSVVNGMLVRKYIHKKK